MVLEGGVLVLLDTLRADRISSYGHVRPTSPEFDLLAAESVRFEQVVSAPPWTLPSVTSLLRSELRRIQPGAGRTIASGEAGKIDPELLDRLHSLGYLR